MALRKHSEGLPGTTYLEIMPKGHLWVVLSDYRQKEDEVVVVNLSTCVPQDATMILAAQKLI